MVVTSLAPRLFKLIFAALIDPSALVTTLVSETVDFAKDMVADKEQAALEKRVARLERLLAEHGLDGPAAELRAVALDDLRDLARRAQDAAKLVRPPPTRTWRKDKDIDGPAALLDARNRVVDFLGRREELDDIRDWCDGTLALAARLVTGAGGMGKTRLLAQAALELREQGWLAGFLSAEARPDSDFGLLVRGADRLLLVIDYAETRRATVTALLKAAREALDDGAHIRVVLLARAVGDWWNDLKDSDPDLGHLFGRPEALKPLEPLPVEQRRAAFDAAAAAFAEQLETAAPAGAPDLSALHFGRMLFVHMAALLAVHGIEVTGEQEILGEIVAFERRHLTRHGEKLGLRSSSLLARAAAAATLALAATGDVNAMEDPRADAAALIARLPEMGDGFAAAEALHTLYPGADGSWLAPVQPDIVGEHLVAEEIDRFDRLPAVVAEHGPAAARSTLTVLCRMDKRAPEIAERGLRTALRGRVWRLAQAVVAAAVDTGGPVGRIAAELAEKEDDGGVAREVAGALPRYSVALLEFAAIVTARALAGATDLAERAGLYNNLAVRLGALGRREEGLAAIEEAVTIRRDLASRRPEAFNPVLATSLSNLSNRYGELGRRDEALAAIEEAVTILRDLASRRPDAFNPDLAQSLNNLSTSYANLGRWEEALALIKEAVTILRDLASRRPDAFNPVLALSLNNLSNSYGDLGRRDEALAEIEEAATIYRDLASQRPDTFNPDLAQSLNNLSGRLADLGRWEEALAAIEEAVTIRRDLASQRPDAFNPVLAKSLGRQGTVLSAMGRHAEAADSLAEGLTIVVPLFRRLPDAFRRLRDALANNYQEACAAAGRTPDPGLLGE
jgi:tetratricopeptide (TPR) repeat protein